MGKVPRQKPLTRATPVRESSIHAGSRTLCVIRPAEAFLFAGRVGTAGRFGQIDHHAAASAFLAGTAYTRCTIEGFVCPIWNAVLPAFLVVAR